MTRLRSRRGSDRALHLIAARAGLLGAALFVTGGILYIVVDANTLSGCFYLAGVVLFTGSRHLQRRETAPLGSASR